MKISKNELQEEIKAYSATVVTTLVLVFLSWPLVSRIGIAPLYLLYLLLVAFNTRLWGIWSGVVSTILIMLVLDYLILPPTYSFAIGKTYDLINFTIFFFTSVGLAILVEKTKNSQANEVYKEKERGYLEILTKLQKENVKYQKEIKARDEFLSIASHELKTPLSSMLLQLQTALHNIRNVSLANFSVENLMRMLQSAEQQSRRLSKMINDLLNVSLITTGRLDLEKEEFDLAELAKDVVERISEKENREKHKIHLYTKTPIIGLWDKLRIEQVVTNLITNAIKYGDNKPVEVELSKSDSKAILTVIDHGIGIPQSRQERIFEKFERGVSNHDFKGLGVGLYITAQIVKAHEGTITVKSKENSGSKFTVELPIKRLIAKKG